MTTPPGLRELPAVYYRRAAAPTAGLTVLGTTMGALGWGRAEALGVLVGGVIVLVFFGVDVLALVVSADWDPAIVFLLVMIEYVTKIVVLGLILIAVADQDVVNGRALALSVGLNTVVFLTFLVTAHIRVPTFVVDPTSDDGDGARGT